MSGERSLRFVDRRAALAVAARPRLWWPAMALVLRMAPRGWWRRWPPLPSPSAAYAEFRVHTALGGPAGGEHSLETPTGSHTSRTSLDRPPDRPLDAGEVVAFLEWCRQMTVLSRSRRRGG